MDLENIGEFGLINRIAKDIKVGRLGVVKGIGDDTAVLSWTRNNYLLATTDMLIEDVHFRRTAPPTRIGWKAICCGISDIAAMGGIPKWALISCGLPRDLGVKYADRIYSGIKKAAKDFGISIIGGDTNSSKKIILDVTLLGEVKKKNLVLRNGAECGDFIFVTGFLGGSIYGKHLNFTPRLKEAQALVTNFKINSMIDLSDGLASDLLHILKQSGMGAIVYKELIPKSKEAKSIENAFSDGEDFELLFTMSKKESFRLLDLKERLFNIPITRIGTVINKKFGVKIVDIFGRTQELKAEGFRHF
ncbi:MAG: thiamine-phosphate kinase [Candidatus Omnitrophica bacterium]|nr:thiamine-phosphate kinase [Candidatus Omnitrophota bacterium]